MLLACALPVTLSQVIEAGELMYKKLDEYHGGNLSLMAHGEKPLDLIWDKTMETRLPHIARL